MKASMLVLLFAVFSPASSNSVSPVQKVLQLLTDLQAKIVNEGEEAQKVFNEFTEWCEERSANLKYEIKTGKSEVEDLSASIDQAAAKIQELTSKIEEAAASLATNDADLKAATEIREKEAADFAASDKELAETIDVLTRAIMILERDAQKGGASMMQLQKANSVAQALSIMVDAAMLQSQDVSKLTAFVQSVQKTDADEDSDAMGAPDPAAYKSHSGSLIETLESLLDKAKGQLDDARRKETNSRHNFEMLKQSIEDEIKFGNQDMDEAKKNLAASGEAKAAAEGDLAVTSKSLKEDIATQSTLKHDCMTKAEDFEAATQSRGEELKALTDAKKVISDQTGGAEGVVYGGAASFVQLVQSKLSSGADLANFEAVRFIRNLARQHNDAALTQLASRMASVISYGTSAGEDPFAKVKGLIQDMLERLLKNGEADASHKAYCDKEMGETLEKKENKDANIEKLSTKIDSMTARAAQLKDEVAGLQKELAELAASTAAMDKLRRDEHDRFVADKADTEAGLQGVQMALKILREYYASDGKAHEAADGAGGGIIGLLEVVESDFSKAAAQISTTEMSAQSDYDRETKANEITKATKEQDVKYKTKEAKQLDSAVAEATSDREGVQAELSAILEYKGHLVEMCVAKPETYDERKGRREAEIAGLKEALSILEGEAVFLQRGARAGKQHGFLLSHA